MIKRIKGYINSIETLGALDGPGLRAVIFFQGCGLRCKFCHNPDCIELARGQEYTAEALAQEILKYKPYFGEFETGNEIKGGVTFSGGEPTIQTDFIGDLAGILKQEKIHLAIDSCLFTSSKNINKLLPVIDYWMVSIKHMDSQMHKYLTGLGNEKILSNIEFLNNSLIQLGSLARICIRFLLIPGITDKEGNIQKMIRFLLKLQKLDCVEILGYGSHARERWIKLFGYYDLEAVPNATKEDIEKAAEILKKKNINVIY